MTKPHEPSEKDRKQVEAMASYGIPQLDIARVIGISLPTLEKWYRHELDTAASKANSLVAESLFQKARGNGNGAVAACISQGAGVVEPKPWDEVPGRKEQLQQAAATAGGASTEWADDLEVESRPQ